MDKIPKEDQKKLETLFDAGAFKIQSEAEYWISGADEGISYCFDCCKKEVAKLLKAKPDGEYSVDGGWGMEDDLTSYCEICGKLLENTLTDCGCDEEVEHFLLNGFDPKSDDDCRAMSEVISTRGWEMWEGMVYRNAHEQEMDIRYFEDLYKLCVRILEELNV